jgi:hypothetical protein
LFWRISIVAPVSALSRTGYFCTHDVSTGSDDGRLRRPLVVMVEPTDDRKPDDVSTNNLRNRPQRCAGRDPLKQPLMRTGTIEVGLNVLPQYTMQRPFAEDDHGLGTFVARRS